MSLKLASAANSGIRGEQWHQEAIKRAVVKAGWHFKTLPIDPKQAQNASTSGPH